MHRDKGPSREMIDLIARLTRNKLTRVIPLRLSLAELCRPCAALLLFASSLFAASPVITDLSLRGLQIGGVTRLVVRGTGFDDSLQLMLPVTPTPRVVCESISADEANLRIELDAATPADFYPLRVATNAGVSNAFAIGIDRLPQLEFREHLAALPAALHGTLTGDQVLHTEFIGQKGSRVVIDVQAQRLGSRLRPVVRLLSPSNRHLGTAQSARRLSGDARLIVTLPEDGIYRVELQDVVFRGEAPGWFRLLIGDLRVADYVAPLAVRRGVPTRLDLIGSPTNDSILLSPRLDTFASGQSVIAPSHEHGALPFVGPAPWVHYGAWSEQVWNEAEVKSDAALPLLNSPIAIDGQLKTPGEQDIFRIATHGHHKLRIEVMAERWGSPLDAVLHVMNPNGEQVAQADDLPGTTDPGLDLDLDALKLDEIQVRVSSLFPSTGPESAYRLTIAPQLPPAHEFRVDSDRFVLHAGGRLVLPVQIANGPVPTARQFQLPAALQNAVRVTAAEITPQDELGLLSLEAGPMVRGIYTVQLLANTGDVSVSRPVSLVSNGFPGTQYRRAWRDMLTLAVTDPATMRISWREAELPTYLPRGAAVSLPLQVERAAGTQGNVRLSLLTTQREPKKTVDNKEVTDLDRALRIEADTIELTDQTVQNKDVRLIVPIDVPLHDWAIAIKAEQLTEDGQTVTATAFTPVIRRPMIEPLRLVIELNDRQTVPVGEDKGWQVRGRIERHTDFRQPVTVRLNGLTDGDPHPQAIVNPDEQEFTLDLKFPAGTTGREIANTTVEASIETNSEAIDNHKQIVATVRSKPFTLVIESQGK